MVTKLGIAFFGMIVGGVSFLITGFAVLLTISQIENRAIASRAAGPATEQAQFAQFMPRARDPRLSVAPN